jgi:UDP-N-acetylmuramoylalanine--D-glutamate ligase
MSKDDFREKKIAILGVGMEGVAVANFLVDTASKITLCDKLSKEGLVNRAEDDADMTLRNVLSDERFEQNFGTSYMDSLESYDYIFRSPGIPYLNPKIQEVKAAGAEVTSQLKLFFDLCPAKIIGVTGTKGKGTTSSLIETMLKNQKTNIKKQINPKSQISNSKINTDSNSELRTPNSQPNVFLAGNIGRPAISLIDKLKPEDWVILELSSFQLQDLDKSPDIAVIVNMAVDHLDYHKDEAEYFESKTSIVKYQTEKDIVIANKDYPNAVKLAEMSKGQKLYFSGEEEIKGGAFIRKSEIPARSAGGRNPTRFAESRRESETPLRQDFAGQTNSNDQKIKLQTETNEVVLTIDGKEEVVCRSDEINLVGKHNLENIAAAALAASGAGADIESIRKGAKEFMGLSHRLELITEISGVKYYNDSFATNPEPTMAAIKSFSEPVVIILGGSSKKADFAELAQVIKSSSIKTIILIGVEGEIIKKALHASGVSKEIIDGPNNIDDIVALAKSKAEPGDIILFSPACASFDMFKNYKDRGERFKEAVNNTHRFCPQKGH